MLTVIVTIIIVGILLWAVNAYVPMDAKVKNILNIVVIICLVLWLLNVFGILNGLRDVGVPRLR